MAKEVNTLTNLSQLAEKSSNNPSLTEQLRLLPEEAFTRMRILQPEIGCGNVCADCSQLANPSIWSLTTEGLNHLMTSIATVADESAIKLGYKRERHPDTIFPYLDNDIGSYPFLSEFLQRLSQNFGIKAKMTTIGWSRHNQQLQEMHERINQKNLDALTAVSFSLTSYTRALRFGQKLTNPEDYIADLANALKTYQPAINSLGTGKESGCVTLRFKPLVNSYEDGLDDNYIDEFHVIHSGPYLLISKKKQKPPETSIIFSRDGLVFDQPGLDYFVIISDNLTGKHKWKEVARSAVHSLSNGDSLNLDGTVKESKLFLLSNSEGQYYALDPDFQEDGSFKGKFFYPKTEKRPRSGYNDSERYFLNSLIKYKKSLGLRSYDLLPNAKWEDVNGVIEILEKKVDELSKYDRKASEYIRDEVLLLVKTLKNVLQLAGYPPSYFFDPNFTVDTGQVLNQGRAIKDFKGIVVTPNLPTNPQHVRVINTWEKETVWRWAVAPFSRNSKSSSVVGKNVFAIKPGIVIQELNPATLLPFTSEGKKLREFIVETDEVYFEHINGRQELVQKKRIPGIPIS